MIQNYNQTVSICLNRKDRNMQIISILAFFMFVAFVLISVFVHIAFIICALLFFVLCLINTIQFSKLPKEYLYSFNDNSLIIYKKNTLNETKRCLTIYFKDIVSFGVFNSVYDSSKQILLCANPSEEGVCELLFNTATIQQSILITPDTYMNCLIKEAING